MKCPKCNKKLKEVKVKVAGATSKAKSYQCLSCDYFSFEQKSSERVLNELYETPLKIEQKVIKLSGERLGIYFNKHITKSLNLKKGESILISVPDKKHIIIELQNNH